jgi:hypothetical protein
MKAIILLEIENGNTSVVVVEHQYMREVDVLLRQFGERPEVRKATTLAAGLNGRVVIADQHDTPETLAQIAGW